MLYYISKCEDITTNCIQQTYFAITCCFKTLKFLNKSFEEFKKEARYNELTEKQEDIIPPYAFESKIL